MIDNTHLISSLEPWEPQRMDARGSTFNDVKRDQHNVQITINNNYSPNDNVADIPVCPPQSLVHSLDSDPMISGRSKYWPGTKQVPTSAHIRFGCCRECHKIGHDKHRGCCHTPRTAYLVGDCHRHSEIANRHQVYGFYFWSTSLLTMPHRRTVYRYSFFSKSDDICTTICHSCLQMMRLWAGTLGLVILLVKEWFSFQLHAG